MKDNVSYLNAYDKNEVAMGRILDGAISKEELESDSDAVREKKLIETRKAFKALVDFAVKNGFEGDFAKVNSIKMFIKTLDGKSYEKGIELYNNMIRCAPYTYDGEDRFTEMSVIMSSQQGHRVRERIRR